MAVELDKNLIIRAVSAIAALPIVFGSLYAGGIWYLLFILIGVGVILTEWWQVTGTKWFGLLLAGFVISAGLISWLYTQIVSSGVAGVESDGARQAVIIIELVSMALVFAALRLGSNGKRLTWWLVSVAFSMMIAAAMLWLPFQSKTMVVWLFFVVWATDVGGYFFGRAFGGPKLAPGISPNKTWSGAIGGVVLAVAISALITLIADWWAILPAVAAALGLSVVSQMGDLYESTIKRRFAVKDSGGFFPGHGGLLDRIDGLSFAAGFAALALALTAG